MQKPPKRPRKPAPPAIKTAPAKGQLHPRNRHQGLYDFPALIRLSPELGRFVITNPYGKPSIDFADPAAVRVFNRALLRQYYGIEYWDIPEGYLCPPIPGRADYLHNLADLLASDLDGSIPRGGSFRALDIGVGANCIYPLIGHCEYGWHFVGADIAEAALTSARAIVQGNTQLHGAIELRRQEDAAHILLGLLQPDERFDLTLCNPPFHTSAAEATSGSTRKWRNLGKLDPRRKLPQLNFGGQAAELWCPGGEAAFLKRMASESVAVAGQVLWFTSLVSKGGNVELLQRWLEQAKACEVRVLGMSQGQKRSRLVAWTFQNSEQRRTWLVER
ncbi:23S rRNA (adenine(1618)-N(6))-methyltransferase RlmF [Pseudomonas sp. NCCP-436]|uniref:23S rRNA (adenine(1618)-N(6))-methyltransferase RlmF n=1 Tax=Pseudomonas sp. NCCP-436 TaxID=2842481 RepID=UPI001C80E267|nr:23S rRNA (adenine(1618)-N(6))-methyltransferase RlmF [Pseudomonas sp. NCCP-436]GIZ11012.1 ribosomal RNA large subunit methyltransferase F [Pseudomonas sp. NCCP-436]